MIEVNRSRPLWPRFWLLAALIGAGPVWAQPTPPYKSMAVAAAHPQAADAGLAVLRQGGNAIDAAIAVQMVLNVVEPQASGIGGGGLLLYWDAKASKLYAYDGREIAPASAKPDMFMADGAPMQFPLAVFSAKSVGVPGAVALLDSVHRLHGKMPWAKLFEPAIALADQGFTVSPRLGKALAQEQMLFKDSQARAVFFDGEGRPRKEGERIANPALAQTLRLIAKDGASVFYSGTLAQDIVDAVNARGAGTMTLQDLKDYQVKIREAVCGAYRAYKVCGFPPPSSGGIAILQALGMLEGFDLPAMKANQPLPWHLIAEASKLAFADRNRYLADPDFYAVPVKGLLDGAYLRVRAGTIKQDAALPVPAPPGVVQQGSVPPAGVGPELPGTSHIAIVDGEGNVLSFTTTIEAAFGARIMVRGFLLNNELTDFSFVAESDGQAVANAVRPGKRPRSSMSPTIAFDRDGKPVLAIGSAGGATIIGATLKAIIAVLDWNMGAQAAIDLPNVWNANAATDVEPAGYGVELAEALRRLGHNVRAPMFETGLHGLRIGPMGIDGGADPRRDGAVRGQ